MNLSGGQRQRLGLARALYRKADIYLLDDPMSAVDAHVGAHMMNFLLEFKQREKKTVIMSCHQLHQLCHADHIVSISDSTICEAGCFDDLMQAGGEFASLMERHSAGESPATTPRSQIQSEDANLEDEGLGHSMSDVELLGALKGTGKSGSIMSLEDRKTGKVAGATYR